MRVRIGDVHLFFEAYGEQWRLDGGRMRQWPVLIGLHGGPGTDGAKARYQLSRLADLAQVVVPISSDTAEVIMRARISGTS